MKNINKNSAPLLAFEYDATGNRLIKDNHQTNEKQIYIRDAQGNVMVVYQTRHDSLFLDELHLYGSSRLGVIKVNEWLPKQDDNLTNVPPVTLKASPYTLKLYNFGKKRYELADWLGNVRVVINDKKIPMGTSPQNMTYEAQTISVSDYYPFGMLSRSYSSGGYRFGFQGQEGDSEIKGEGNSWNYKFRMQDPRLGRFFSIDPLASKYPWNSPYAFSENRVIDAVEVEGREKLVIIDNYITKKRSIIPLKKAGSLGEGVLTIHITKHTNNVIYQDPYTKNAKTGELSGGKTTKITPKQLGAIGLTNLLLKNKNIPDNFKSQILIGSMGNAQKGFLLKTAMVTGDILEQTGNAVETAGIVVSLVPGGQLVGGGLMSLGESMSSLGSFITAAVEYKKGNTDKTLWKFGTLVGGELVGTAIKNLRNTEKITKTSETILKGVKKMYEGAADKAAEKATEEKYNQ